jgi:hypothetical protein
VREPAIELRHALLGYGNRDLLVGHLLDLGDLGSLSGGLGWSVLGLASLGPVSAPVAVSMAVAAMLAAPFPPAAIGQESGEERVELREALLGNVDCDLLVRRGCGL